MSNPNNTDLYEDSNEQINFIGLYRIMLAGLLFSIFLTGIAITAQAQKRHKTYQEIVRLKRELVAMQVEENRLIIEQQTFSAIPEVARRAVDRLGMYYPSKKEQMRGELEHSAEQELLHTPQEGVHE